MCSLDEEISKVMRIFTLVYEINWRWLVFFAAILCAWLLIALMQPGFQSRLDSNGLSYSFIASLCISDARDASYLSIFLMWGLMSFAMMAPTAFPAIKTYYDLQFAEEVSTGDLMYFVCGYVTAWLGFSLLASVFQVILAQTEMLDSTGRSINLWLNSILLLTAGFYQFSVLKNACLSKCRSPLVYFIENWRNGPSNAFNLGIGLGIVCVGCCWALMTLAFLGGIMNLAWMAGAMVIMTIEKLPEPGRYLTRLLGILLIIGSVVTAYNAL